MNPTSALQQQFALDPKKFWKKVIEKLTALYILGAMVAIVLLVIIWQSAGSSADHEVNTVLWIVLVLGLIVLLVISALYSWYVKTYIKRYYYAGEDNFITIKKGVFAPTEIHVQWQKIQDVYVDQDILDRILGLYDVHIASATASSGIEAHIDGVNQQSAEGLKKFLLAKISGTGMSSAQNSTVTPGVTQTQSAPAQPATINFSGDLSSDAYPLSGKWTVVTLISRLLSSISYPFIIILVIFGKSKNLTIEDDWQYWVLIWIGLTIITMIGRTIALFLWKKNYAFKFGPENIYYKEGVISLSEKHMPYSSIQDVTVRQGVVERFFGLAKVVIENAAQQSVPVGRYGQKMAVSSGVVLQGFSIAEANKIADMLKTSVLGKNSGKYGI